MRIFRVFDERLHILYEKKKFFLKILETDNFKAVQDLKKFIRYSTKGAFHYTLICISLLIN